MIQHKPVLIVVFHNTLGVDISSVILMEIHFGFQKVVSYVYTINQDML